MARARMDQGKEDEVAFSNSTHIKYLVQSTLQ
jgi:hypothetical protein